MMRLLDQVHERFVYDRRTEVLADAIAAQIPANARVLDVGCGDGRISSMIRARRPDVTIEGIDVLIRPTTHIPVTKFNGTRIPFDDKTFDAVIFVDVLHHTDDPAVLLREARRVARTCVILKDHTRDGLLAGPVLLFMDWVGNCRHGVAVVANYWPEEQWRRTFAEVGLKPEYWTQDIALYPPWASWVFGRSLHCITRLVPTGA